MTLLLPNISRKFVISQLAVVSVPVLAFCWHCWQTSDPTVFIWPRPEPYAVKREHCGR